MRYEASKQTRVLVLAPGSMTTLIRMRRDVAMLSLESEQIQDRLTRAKLDLPISVFTSNMSGQLGDTWNLPACGVSCADDSCLILHRPGADDITMGSHR